MRTITRPLRALALLLTLGAAVAGLSGCGQKGPLVPPPPSALVHAQ